MPLRKIPQGIPDGEDFLLFRQDVLAFRGVVDTGVIRPGLRQFSRYAGQDFFLE